jgi:hypothetical protein
MSFRCFACGELQLPFRRDGSERWVYPKPVRMTVMIRKVRYQLLGYRTTTGFETAKEADVCRRCAPRVTVEIVQEPFQKQVFDATPTRRKVPGKDRRRRRL